MPQFDFGSIDPAVTSGTDLSVVLGNFRDALYSSHKGPAEPPYKRAGLMWVKDDVSPWQWRMCTGTNWATIGTINPTTHALQLYHGGIPLGLLATKNSLNGTEMDDDFLAARHFPNGLITPAMLANGPLGHTIRFNPVTGAAETTPMTGLGMAVQVFTSTGVYTPAAGMRFCIVEVVGAGGSGGKGGSSSNGAGGGGGGYARRLLTALQVGASQPVTIGNGGAQQTSNGAPGNNGQTTSFGTLVSATGGKGGGAGAVATLILGGEPGVGVNGDINMQGGPGTPLASPTSVVEFTPGGHSFFSGSVHTNGGSALANTGAGGNGVGGGNNNLHSGRGASGICIITEFL